MVQMKRELDINKLIKAIKKKYKKDKRTLFTLDFMGMQYMSDVIDRDHFAFILGLLFNDGYKGIELFNAYNKQTTNKKQKEEN